MRDQLLQISRSNAPTLAEPHGRKRRKLIPWKTEKLEPRATTLDRNPLFSNCTNLYRSRWQFTRDLTQFFCRDCNRTRNIHICHHFRTHRNIEICSGQFDPFICRLQKNIRQYRECRLRWDAGSYSCKPLLKLFARDRKAHPFPLWNSSDVLIVSI